MKFSFKHDKNQPSILDRSYGADVFSVTLVFFSCILLGIEYMVHTGYLNWFAIATLLYAAFRTTSFNKKARTDELKMFKRMFGMKSGAPETVVVECPKCKQKTRVPKLGKTIRATCPKCKSKFEVKK